MIVEIHRSRLYLGNILDEMKSDLYMSVKDHIHAYVVQDIHQDICVILVQSRDSCVCKHCADWSGQINWAKLEN